MVSYKDLREQIAKLEAEADAARQRELADVIADIRQKIVEYRLSAQDLGFAPRRRTAGLGALKPPLPPKYQNPRTGQTWSGRGKPPKWIAGKNRDRFLIQ
jgi:DNA-binding protein H-NS